MAWADSINRLNRACETAFGESCILRPQAGGSYPFTGVYSAANRRTKVDPATHTRYETTEQTLHFSRADVPVEPEQQDLVDVPIGKPSVLTTFEIREVEQDGSLGWLLSLREVPA